MAIPMEWERAWLARCAPIFMQPEVDVRKGNGIVKLFFQFKHEREGRLDCDLVVVLEVKKTQSLWSPLSSCYL